MYIPRIDDRVRDKGSQRLGTVIEVTKIGAVVKFDGREDLPQVYLQFDRLARA